MAKSSSTNALQFVFDPAKLRTLLSRNPDKVVFTVTVEQVVTKEGEKVGALKINAVGTTKGKKTTTRDGGTNGCPVPPCMPW
jgi:dTDP-4-dehydrorhamnose reductase